MRASESTLIASEVPGHWDGARRLLSLLFADLAPAERVNLRLLGKAGVRSLFVPSVEQAIAIAAAARHQWAIVFGVLPRLGHDGSSRGVARATCLWADLDAHGEPNGPIRRLAEFRPPPTAVVHSGGGLHAYWLLRESVPLSDESARADFARQLRLLARALGADSAAAEPARTLRLPGSLNFKYDPPRLARLARLAPERRYSLDDLASAAADQRTRGEVAAREPARAPKWVTRLLIEGAPLHQRNVACARLAGYLHRHGLPADVIRAIVVGFAARCRPPLAAREAEAVVRSIARYPRGADSRPDGRADSSRR